MADKDKLIDSPGYDPNARVPFPPPPGVPSPFGTPPVRKEQDPPKKRPFYENYDPNPLESDINRQD